MPDFSLCKRAAQHSSRNLRKGKKRTGNHIVKTGSLAKIGIAMPVEISAVLIVR
jgi:hypothetical protein